MSKTRFAFVKDKVARTHLDRVFELVVVLLTLSEAKNYSPELQSSFRKTIIIYTASIIEALLLLILKAHTTETECAEIKDQITRTLYVISEKEHIALVQKKKVKAKFNKLNLDQISKLCKNHNLITKALSGKVDKVRTLRNRQHLGALEKLEVIYTKRDLEFVFSVAKAVTHVAELMLVSHGKIEKKR